TDVASSGSAGSSAPGSCSPRSSSSAGASGSSAAAAGSSGPSGASRPVLEGAPPASASPEDGPGAVVAVPPPLPAGFAGATEPEGPAGPPPSRGRVAGRGGAGAGFGAAAGGAAAASHATEGGATRGGDFARCGRNDQPSTAHRSGRRRPAAPTVENCQLPPGEAYQYDHESAAGSPHAHSGAGGTPPMPHTNPPLLGCGRTCAAAYSASMPVLPASTVTQRCWTGPEPGSMTTMTATLPAGAGPQDAAAAGSAANGPPRIAPSPPSSIAVAATSATLRFCDARSGFTPRPRSTERVGRVRRRGSGTPATRRGERHRGTEQEQGRTDRREVRGLGAGPRERAGSTPTAARALRGEVDDVGHRIGSARRVVTGAAVRRATDRHRRRGRRGGGGGRRGGRGGRRARVLERHRHQG